MKQRHFNLKDLIKINADRTGATFLMSNGKTIRLPNQQIDFGRHAKSSFKQNKRKGL